MKTRKEQMTSGGLDSYSNFIGDDTDYQDWFGVLGQSRDSDCLGRSNFEVGLEMLGGESDTVRVEGYGHWACGWIEEIYVKPGSEAHKIAQDIEVKLANYPILDESHFCEMEWNEASDIWQSLPISERVELCQKENISIFEARHNWIPQSDSGCIFDYLVQ